MSEKQIFTRFGLSDIVVTKEVGHDINKWQSIRDKNRKDVTFCETYLIGYEDEDGNECKENGDEL
jgi:hypothetical protein